MAMSRYLIEAQDIVKDFMVGNTVSHVLKNVSVGVAAGEFTAVMGPSGSGKSTLLYILSGLDKPTKGCVLLNGRDISGFDDLTQSRMRRRSIGFVFQFYNLIPNLNVAENILLPVLLDGKKAGDYEKRLAGILEVVGLQDKRRHTPRELSGGQQQRVAIARALINDPDIIFADEPTGNLDSKTGTEILTLLQEINREQNKTVIMVTHSKTAAAYGNRTIWVKDGSITNKEAIQ
jgi:putative ABC transport system ATP-binding protein